MEELEKIVNSDKARFVLKQKNGKTIRINLDHALRNRGTPVTKDDVVVDERGRRFVIGAGSEQSADRVANGPRPGDRIFRKMEEISVVHRSRRYYNLEVGDIVERTTGRWRFCIVEPTTNITQSINASIQNHHSSRQILSF